MALWSRLFSGIFGVGVGIAAADAVEPVIEVAKQEAWKGNANRVLDAGQLAALLAQGLADPAEALDQAERQGYNADKLEHLAQLAMHAPDVNQAMRLWRLGEINFAQVQHALRKAGIEPQWDKFIRQEKTLPLSPADLANAVQQGFIPNANLLPSDPGGKPPFTPPVDEVPLPTLDEFVAGAVDDDHAKVLAQLVGLPPGVMELLDMWNRGIVTETAVEHGIREGHTKTKWTSALKELRHYVLSPQDWAGLWLRGWATQKEAEAGGALRGASTETMLRLYQNRGRPATVHQVHIGYARGGSHPDHKNNERAAALAAVQQSDIRREWFDVLWEGRYTYPSAFVIRALTQDGTFDRATAHQTLLEMGWKPELATLAADAWSGAKGGTAAKWADRQRTRLFTAAHDDYMDGNADEAEARALLGAIGMSKGEEDEVIRLFNVERARTRRDLTQAQILKLYKKSIWTREQALAALDDLGMDAGDASDLLDAV